MASFTKIEINFKYGKCLFCGRGNTMEKPFKTTMQLVHEDKVILTAPCYSIGQGMLFFVRRPHSCCTTFVSDRDMHTINYDTKDDDPDNKDNLPELTFPCFFQTKKDIYFSGGMGGMDKLVTLKD